MKGQPLFAVGFLLFAASDLVAQTGTDRFGDPLPPGALARLGTTRFRHEGRVFNVAVSADSRIIAAGGELTVCVWDTTTGQELQRLPGNPVSSTSVALAPDGRTLAAACGQWGVRVWDVETGEELGRPDPWSPPEGQPSRHMSSVQFADRGRRLLTRGYDSEPRDIRDVTQLWDLATGTEVHRFSELPAKSGWRVISPDGHRLATWVLPDGNNESVIVLLDIETGEQLLRRPAPADGLPALVFAPDGASIAMAVGSGGASVVVIWDTTTGEEHRRLEGHGGVVFSLGYSADARVLAATDDWTQTRFTLWDLASGEPLGVFPVPPLTRHGAFLDRDQLLVTCGGGNTLQFRESATGRPVRRYDGHDAGITDLALSPDGKTIATAGGQEVRLWDSNSGELLDRLPEASDLKFVAFSPDGKRLAFGGKDGIIRLWEPATRRVVARLEGHRGWVTGLKFSPDGRHLASTGEEATVRLWELATGKERHRWNSNMSMTGLAFSPDGTILAVSSCGGDPQQGWRGSRLRLWNVTSGKELAAPDVNEHVWVNDVAFSPDGRTLAVTVFDQLHSPRKLRLLEVATGRERLAGALPGTITGVAFSPDRRLLAVCNHAGIRGGPDPEGHIRDRTVIRVLDALTGQEVHRLVGHRGGVSRLAFSPDGRRLVSASQDTTVLIWDLTEIRNRKQAAPAELSREDFRTLWTELAAGDAAKAYRAIGRLAISGDQAVLLLKEELRPVAAADPQKVARLLTELDSPTFAVRERATRDLGALGPQAESALQKALAGQVSPEARRRIEELLRKLNADRLRTLRAIEALEHLATPAAHAFLKDLAAGEPEAALTREAKATLDRLKRR